MAKPSIKLTAREQCRIDRWLRAAAKVPLQAKIAFMKAWLSPDKLLLEDLAKSQGITTDAAWGIIYNPPTWSQRVALQVKELPKATCQTFLDSVKEGKTVGEAQALAGITNEASLYLLKRAMKAHRYYTMDWVAK